MAELNHASCHLGLMLNSCLLQWHWGLKGGKPKEEDWYPAIPAGIYTPPMAKRIAKQAEIVSRYNAKMLSTWGLDGTKSPRDGVLYSVNTKVSMINGALRKHLAEPPTYVDGLAILTCVLGLAFRDLKELERHYNNDWRLLVQTLETLAKLIAKPGFSEVAEAIYADIKPWFMGTAALCDWEG
jgi:hypothetical protein